MMKRIILPLVIVLLISVDTRGYGQQRALSKPAVSGYENQRRPDAGNGRYRNPILGGDYPDPSVLRVGDDFFMTHSSFEYYPGLLIWHSKDLVNWEPVCRALHDYIGSVWAPDFIKYGNTYYIYFPANGTNWVITAPSPSGPWSKPVNLNVNHIDPGHVVGPDNKRYLHLSGGYIIQLADNGLATVGDLSQVYDGWQYPKEWNVECFCLESPKLTKRNSYYYLTVAEGGTAGPATSHMVVSSRSKTPWGPWENSPCNPIVHTMNKGETWWSRGHGTLVDDRDGNWWILYHGYEKGYFTLGRQTLMEPIQWTEDGWFKIPDGTDVAGLIKKPAGDTISKGMRLSDDFAGDSLNLQWHFYKEYEPERLIYTGSGLTMNAKGSTPSDSTPMLCIPVNHSYEIAVELELSGDVSGGLVLFYSPEANCGIGVDRDYFVTYMRGQAHARERNTLGKHVYLRLVNDEHELTTYFSGDGKTWTKSDRSIETSGYHHNTFGGFLSLRTGIFSAGKGTVTFRNFSYRGLE